VCIITVLKVINNHCTKSMNLKNFKPSCCRSFVSALCMQYSKPIKTDKCPLEKFSLIMFIYTELRTYNKLSKYVEI